MSLRGCRGAKLPTSPVRKRFQRNRGGEGCGERRGCPAFPHLGTYELLLTQFRGAGPDTFSGELEDGGVVHEPIDGGHRGHRVLEDLVPLGEDQVRGDDDGLFLVAFGEEVKEHLHLLAGLLDVADVVDDDGVEALESSDRLRQFQVALGGEQLA